MIKIRVNGSVGFLQEVTEDELQNIFDNNENIFDVNKLSFGKLFGDKTRILLPDVIEKNVDFKTPLYKIEKIKNSDGTTFNKKIQIDSILPSFEKALTYNIYNGSNIHGKISVRDKKFISNKFKNGVSLFSFLDKIIEFSNKKDFERILNLLGDDDALENFLVYLKVDNTLGKRNLETIDLDYNFLSKVCVTVKEQLQLFYSTIASGDLSLRIIVSRHPVDVYRMSDHPGMGSCHSPRSANAGGMGAYHKCAIQEAKGHGFVAYIVQNKDLKLIDLFDQTREIFRDPKRNISGIVPISRIRLRKIVAITKDDKKIEIFSPEDRVYGDSTYKAQLLSSVLNWARASQKEVANYVDNNEDNIKNFQMYSTWSDHGSGQQAEVELLNKIGINTTKDKVVTRYSKEEKYKNSYGDQQRIDSSDVEQVFIDFKNSNDYVESYYWNIQEIDDGGFGNKNGENFSWIHIQEIKYEIDFTKISHEIDEKIMDAIEKMTFGGKIGHKKTEIYQTINTEILNLFGGFDDVYIDFDIQRKTFIIFAHPLDENENHNSDDIIENLRYFPTEEDITNRLKTLAYSLIENKKIEYKTELDYFYPPEGSKEDTQNDDGKLLFQKELDGSYTIIYQIFENNIAEVLYSKERQISDMFQQKRNEYNEKFPYERDLIKKLSSEEKEFYRIFKNNAESIMGNQQIFSPVLRDTVIERAEFDYKQKTKTKPNNQMIKNCVELFKYYYSYEYFETTEYGKNLDLLNSKIRNFIKKIIDVSSAVIRQKLSVLWEELRFLPELRMSLTGGIISIYFESKYFDKQTISVLRRFVNIFQENEEKVSNVITKTLVEVYSDEIRKNKDLVNESKVKSKIFLRIR